MKNRYGNLMGNITVLISGVDQTIERILKDLSLAVYTTLIDRLEHLLVNPDDVDEITILGEKLRSLFTATYDKVEHESGLTPSTYMAEVVDNVETFTDDNVQDDLRILTTYGDELDYLRNITTGLVVSINPRMWINSLQNLSTTISNHVRDSFAPCVYYDVFNSISTECESKLGNTQLELKSIGNVYQKNQRLSELLTQVREMTKDLETQLSQPTARIQEFLQTVQTYLNGFSEKGTKPTLQRFAYSQNYE